MKKRLTRGFSPLFGTLANSFSLKVRRYGAAKQRLLPGSAIVVQRSNPFNDHFPHGREKFSSPKGRRKRVCIMCTCGTCGQPDLVSGAEIANHAAKLGVDPRTLALDPRCLCRRNAERKAQFEQDRTFPGVRSDVQGMPHRE